MILRRIAPAWGFYECVPIDRAERLLAVEGFDSVIAAVAAAKVSSWEWMPARAEHLRGCSRAEFLMRVTPETYDAFFNSPFGYRAEYARSKKRGVASNRRLIDSITQQLLAYAGAEAEGIVAASLEGMDAKVWINNDKVELARGPAAIAFERWMRASDRRGTRAPCGTELLVMGGWVDTEGRERIDPNKSLRGFEIHQRGFS